MVGSLPLNLRRAHTKSRTGCTECRRRRVKCGEEKPSCRHCLRREIPCLYSCRTTTATCPTRPSSLSTSDAHAAPRSPSPASSSAVPTPFIGAEERHRAVPEYTIEDMALFHHWTLTTSQSIAGCSGVDRYWQTVFPQIAFRHPFVMYGILSLALLHQAYLYPESRKRLTTEAARYHNQSLHGLRHGISQMNDDSSDALFVCTSLNIVYVFGIYGKLYDDTAGGASAAARTSRILGADWIPMVRGVEAVLHPLYERVRVGPLKSLLNLGNWEDLDPDRVQVVDDDGFRSLQNIWAENGDREIYDQTLYLLRKCRAFMNQFHNVDADALQDMSYHRKTSAPLVWMHFAPNEYFVRLHQRQPPALLIFAYFGSLFHCLDGYWFFEGWGRSIVGVVDEILGDYWGPWLEWPKQVVGLS